MNNLLCGMITGIMLLLPAFIAEVNGQDSIGDARNEKTRLERELRSLDARIRTTDSLILHEKAQAALLQKRLSNGIEQKNGAIIALHAKLAELDKEISQQTGVIESHRARGRAFDSRRTYVTAQLAEHCDALEKSIRNSLPWNREQRLARVSALRSDLEANASAIEDGFARLLALVEEEIAFGDEIVLDNRTIERNDGTSLAARVLRIGNLWMVYTDVSEEFYGILNRVTDSTFAWKEQLDFTQREQIRTAIRVKESKKAPQMISLPLDISAVQSRENRND